MNQISYLSLFILLVPFSLNLKGISKNRRVQLSQSSGGSDCCSVECCRGSVSQIDIQSSVFACEFASFKMKMPCNQLLEEKHTLGHNIVSVCLSIYIHLLVCLCQVYLYLWGEIAYSNSDQCSITESAHILASSIFINTDYH